MKKLVLIALAAGVAALPAGALAQAGHAGAGAGVSVRHGGNVTVRHGGGFRHPGRNFRHHRLQRGFFIHPFWSGPQFHVQNWQLYGFSPPPRDHRWVRYYDDAYLVDREGRVQDTRYGLDWDEYGERWEMDEGIPSYYGRGEWRPDERDYAWVERHGPGGEEGWDYGGYGQDGGYAEEGRYEHERGYEHEGDYQHGGGYAHGEAYGPGPGYPPPQSCRPAPQPCGGPGYGYGYGAGYGYYGYGVAYPIIIETTVHGGGCCAATTYVEEVTEEVVEVQRPRRHYRPAPRPRPRPRPPAGERG